jgi:hypothetical protein
MHHPLHLNTYEYTVIGAGPAAIIAIANLLKSGINGETILWIDPDFNVGHFGTQLSVGSSVPGNTTVQSYQTVNHEIYKLFDGPQLHFAINDLEPHLVCLLKIAAEPLLHITQFLRQKVKSENAWVSHINTNQNSYDIINKANGSIQTKRSKRVILATGAQPKQLSLPEQHRSIIQIDPHIAFIESELLQYKNKHADLKTIAVVGSSHSAALATMHLLKAGFHVKQFMNKEYKYAQPALSASGIKYTLYDNTGLKGDVARFTKDLLNDPSHEMHQRLTRYIAAHRHEVHDLLDQHLNDCSHFVATIGYEATPTLLVDQQPLSSLIHNAHTTEFVNKRGLFGIGIAFPQEVTAISGEVEFAVGVGKFMTTMKNPLILKIWHDSA